MFRRKNITFEAAQSQLIKTEAEFSRNVFHMIHGTETTFGNKCGIKEIDGIDKDCTMCKKCKGGE